MWVHITIVALVAVVFLTRLTITLAKRPRKN
jgi:hypothetical protein